MDAREMNLFMNLVIYGLGKGMTNLMSDSLLVARQAGMAMIDGKASVLLKGLGFPEFDGSESIDAILRKITDFLVDKKIAQKIDIHKSTENDIKLEIRDCIFAQASRMARESNIAPLCPLIGLVISTARKITGKELTIKSNVFYPDTNSEIFEIEIAEF